MRFQTIFNFILFCFLLACTPQQSSEALFRPADEPPGVVAPDKPTIMRSRYVTVNFGLLERADPGEPRTIVLNLFEDATFTAILDEYEEPSAESYVWSGQIEGQEDSLVTMAVENDVMSANIAMHDIQYQVRFVDEGVHAIYQIDQSAFPPEAEPIPVSTP